MKKLIVAAVSIMMIGLSAAVLGVNHSELENGTQARALDSDIPSYSPQQVAPTAGAGYVLPDGSIQIIGFDDMSGILESLNTLFAQSHPGVKFKDVPVNNLASLHALIFDATAFAPVGTEFLSAAGAPYRAIVHAEPFAIRVAHASLNPKAKLSPLVIIVNKSNPLESLTADQVTHIFTTGGRKADIVRWSQVGLKGELASREIHPCGLPESDHYPSEDASFGEYMFLRKLGGGHSARNYQMLTAYADVVKKVSVDPQAIGITAFNRVSADVKVLGVIANDWAKPSSVTADEIINGKYPYDRYLYIYVRRVPGQPIDPFVKEYLRLVLSREGQVAIAAEAHGYLPLSAREVAEELGRLE